MYLAPKMRFTTQLAVCVITIASIRSYQTDNAVRGVCTSNSYNPTGSCDAFMPLISVVVSFPVDASLFCRHEKIGCLYFTLCEYKEWVSNIPQDITCDPLPSCPQCPWG